MLGIGADDACPCDSGLPYGGCCGPLHRGRVAETAEALMRSRYSAYALGETDHLWRTWHPRTRPERVTERDALVWRGLVVEEVVDGGTDDEEGVVQFTATYDGPAGRAVLHERSRFARRGGRWVYVDGVEPGPS
ncbi:hypothetical protein MJ876_04735 [Nocardioides sp. CFH 31398]|nr:hypothetical protein [Nocardioides sp. CFH 31398]